MFLLYSNKSVHVYFDHFNFFRKPDGPQASTSSISKTDQVLREVLDTLDCPVCLEFLKTPIYMCESGHDLCSLCRTKLPLPICPLCNTSITNQRNYRLEAIVEKVLIY